MASTVNGIYPYTWNGDCSSIMGCVAVDFTDESVTNPGNDIVVNVTYPSAPGSGSTQPDFAQAGYPSVSNRYYLIVPLEYPRTCSNLGTGNLTITVTDSDNTTTSPPSVIPIVFGSTAPP